MTTFEIWKWLLRPARAYDLFEVDQALLESVWLKSRVAFSCGVFSLRGVDISAQTQKRQRRFLDATRKFKKLRRACLFFQMISGVQAVCAANTMAWWHTSEQSDIDLFVVTKPGRVWSSRFFLVLPFLLSGSRPHNDYGADTIDPFCFSFFATARALQMEPLKVDHEDYYLAYWVKSLVPIFDNGEAMNKISTLNKWADALLPNARMRDTHQLHRPMFRLRFVNLPMVFEPVFRLVQRRRFPSVLRELANKDTRVVITDDILKFHENDRRREFKQKFEDQLSQMVSGT